MPYILNGIGTWYYGERNITRRRGVCGQCNRAADLSSHDTTLFFVFFMVPLLPLGSKRIVDLCPACSRHTVVPLNKWQAAQKEGIERTIKDVQESPDDPEKAIAALATAVGFQDETTFLGLTAIVEPRHADHHRVQAALGEAYTYFGHHAAALDAWERAIALAPDPAAQTRVGVLHTMNGSVDRAAELLRPVLAEPRRDDIGALYLLVEAYQSHGRHAESLELLHKINEVFPGQDRDKGWRQYEKTARKNMATGKKVASALVQRSAGKPVRERPRLARLPLLIGPALAIAGLGVYIGAAWWIGGHRRVHVVNGLDSAYVAEVGGTRLTLAAHSRVEARVAEGDVAVRILGAATQPPSTAASAGNASGTQGGGTVSIRTGFWSRPFDSTEFIVNPDKMALLVEVTTTYSANPAPTGASDLHTGHVMYEFTDLDYLFEPFPHSLKVSSRQGTLTKRRLDLARFTPVQTLSAVESASGPDAAKRYAINALAHAPTDPMWHALAAAYADDADVLDAVRPLLDRRPLMIEPHRTYQSITERGPDAARMVQTYRTLLAEEPTDPVRKYLLGRVVSDVDEADRLFREAASDPKPVAHARMAVAYGLLSRGLFEESLAAIRGAMALDPTNPSFESLEVQALLALKRGDELIAKPRFQSPWQQLDTSDGLTKLAILRRCHGVAAAEAGATEWVDAVASEYPDQRESAAKALAAQVAYLRGDESEMARLTQEQATDSESDLSATSWLLMGNLEKSLEAATKARAEGEVSDLLLVHLAALRADNLVVADAAREAAISALRRGRGEEQVAGEWLAGAIEFTSADVLRHPLGVDLKAPLLVALGIRMPEFRSEFFELARALNFDPRWPSLLLEAVMKQASDSAG